MRIKSIIVALLASLSVVAHAQTQSGTPTDTQQAITSGSSRMISVDQLQPAAFTVGWNYIHAAACQPYYDGTFNWLFVYAAEGPALYTAFPPFVNSLIPACQSGNLIALYVTDSGGAVSNLQVFSRK